jgi:hypothetical protein
MRPGDSGSWVVEEATGQVLGHVVSVDMFNEAYVMPIRATLQNIAEHLHAERVTLPTRESIASYRSRTHLESQRFSSEAPALGITLEHAPESPDTHKVSNEKDKGNVDYNPLNNRTTPSMSTRYSNIPSAQSEASPLRIKSDGNTSTEPKHPRISRPVALMRSSYDCVVIGSGYGGGVAASRMARSGQSVCVLERGKERWPGEYPKDTNEVLDQLHCSGTPSATSRQSGVAPAGGPTGMYHLISGNGQNVFVGNGKIFGTLSACSTTADADVPGN